MHRLIGNGIAIARSVKLFCADDALHPLVHTSHGILMWTPLGQFMVFDRRLAFVKPF